jgi:hypothetical protein
MYSFWQSSAFMLVSVSCRQVITTISVVQPCWFCWAVRMPSNQGKECNKNVCTEFPHGLNVRQAPDNGQAILNLDLHALRTYTMNSAKV